MGALVSTPGTAMEAGSVDGLHRGGLGSMGVVIVACTGYQVRTSAHETRVVTRDRRVQPDQLQ